MLNSKIKLFKNRLVHKNATRNEMPRGLAISQISTEIGYPLPQSLIDLPCIPRTILHWCQMVSWDPMNEKTMFLKNKHIWALQNCMVTMVTPNTILTGRGVHTNVNTKTGSRNNIIYATTKCHTFLEINICRL